MGDAAGLADPLTGEGIYYAHKSAEQASKALKEYFRMDGNIDLVECYKKYLRPVYKKLKYSCVLRDLGYTRLRYGVYWLNSPLIYKEMAKYIHGLKISSLL
ncbi:hypothetical protein KGY73_05785 [bacterium]|nr:hypothetical protein [bacterium]